MSWETWTPVELPVSKAMDGRPGWFGPKAEIRRWLEANVGEKARFFTNGPTGEWHHDVPISRDWITFYFRKPDKAMLFKLTWA